MISPWDAGTNLYERALDVRSAIHETIASNMANEETPGYQARHLPFPETLSAVLQGQGPLGTATTHSRHLGTQSMDKKIFHQITEAMFCKLCEQTMHYYTVWL